MVDINVDVRVNDKIDKGITANLKTMAVDADKSAKGIDRVDKALGGIEKTKLNRVKKELADSRKEVDRLTKALRDAESGGKDLGGAFSSLKGLAAGAAAAFGVGTIALAADEYAILRNALEASSSSIGEVERKMADVQRISQETGRSLGFVGQLYNDVTAAAKDSVVSQEAAARAVESIIKTAKVSEGEFEGASRGIAESLTAAFQAGEIATDIESDTKDAVEFYQALATEAHKAGKIGVASIGELSLAFAEKRLTIKDFNDLVIASGESIDEAFGQKRFTVEQSLNVLTNSFKVLSGSFAEFFGFGAQFKSFVDTIAGNAGRLTLTMGAVGGALAFAFRAEISKLISGIAGAFGRLAKQAIALAASMGPLVLKFAAFAGAVYVISGAIKGFDNVNKALLLQVEKLASSIKGAAIDVLGWVDSSTKGNFATRQWINEMLDAIGISSKFQLNINDAGDSFEELSDKMSDLEKVKGVLKAVSDAVAELQGRYKAGLITIDDYRTELGKQQGRLSVLSQTYPELAKSIVGLQEQIAKMIGKLGEGTRELSRIEKGFDFFNQTSGKVSESIGVINEAFTRGILDAKEADAAFDQVLKTIQDGAVQFPEFQAGWEELSKQVRANAHAIQLWLDKQNEVEASIARSLAVYNDLRSGATALAEAEQNLSIATQQVRNALARGDISETEGDNFIAKYEGEVRKAEATIANAKLTPDQQATKKIWQGMAADIMGIMGQLGDSFANAFAEAIVEVEVGFHGLIDLLQGALKQAIKAIIAELIKVLALKAAAAIATGGASGLLFQKGGYVPYPSNIKQFPTGGYTGNIPSSQVAGLVHGGEFVFNQRATSNLGVSRLQSLQNQGQQGAVGGGDMAGKVNIKIVNVVAGEGDDEASDDRETEIVNVISRRQSEVMEIVV